MIVLPQLKLCYQDLPKVASTTTFSWLYECCHGEPYPREKGRVHSSLTTGPNPAGIALDNGAFRAADYPDHFIFALTRDPVRRFISMYSNRVIFHRELSEDSTFADRIQALGLPFSPEINFLADNLDAYQQVMPSIHHHSRPMVDFLGRDMGIYHRIVDIRQFPELASDIRAHFERMGRPEVAKIAPPAERMQSGGPKLGLEVLNPHSFELLLEYYKEDYALVPTVNLAATRDAWLAARKAWQAEVKSRLPAALAIPARRKAQQLPVVSRPACPVAATFVEEKAFPARLAGQVLLQAKFSPADWKLRGVLDGKEVPVEWGIPSPALAGKHADNPNAANARFNVEGLQAMRREFALELHGPAGQHWAIVRLAPARR